jgi:hypothetical protein
MSVLCGLASCINLSVRILDLLLTSKHNKHEFRSLKAAVDNIRVFLTALPQEGITQQGNEVLSEYNSSSSGFLIFLSQMLHPEMTGMLHAWCCGQSHPQAPTTPHQEPNCKTPHGLHVYLHVCDVALAGQLHAQLLRVHALLGKVSAMGPLVSLLKAHIVREEFLHTNRDLLDTFGILARGEQLLVSHVVQWSMQSTMVARPKKDHPRGHHGTDASP